MAAFVNATQCGGAPFETESYTNSGVRVGAVKARTPMQFKHLGFNSKERKL
jgi:hypothetical protein